MQVQKFNKNKVAEAVVFLNETLDHFSYKATEHRNTLFQNCTKTGQFSEYNQFYDLWVTASRAATNNEHSLSLCFMNGNQDLLKISKRYKAFSAAVFECMNAVLYNEPDATQTLIDHYKTALLYDVETTRYIINAIEAEKQEQARRTDAIISKIPPRQNLRVSVEKKTA